MLHLSYTYKLYNEAKLKSNRGYKGVVRVSRPERGFFKYQWFIPWPINMIYVFAPPTGPGMGQIRKSTRAISGDVFAEIVFPHMGSQA